MLTYLAAELIMNAKAFIAADAARMSRRPAGVPKAAWRTANPIKSPSYAVRDLTAQGRTCAMTFDLNGSPYDLWVWRENDLIARIDLRAADADEQLQRFKQAP